MNKITNIEKAIQTYKEEKERLNLLRETTEKIINSNIDFKEIEDKLTYKETKQLYKLIGIYITIECREKFNTLLQKKKEKEYPEIKGVHYYPIIKSIDCLNEEEKIDLDNLIKKAYRHLPSRETLSKYDEQVLNILCENKIIEKVYELSCGHDSWDCEPKIIKNSKFLKLKNYWEKEENGIEPTQEENDELSYGCFEIGCDRDCIEVTNLEEFEDHLTTTNYTILEKPDLTLDNL